VGHLGGGVKRQWEDAVGDGIASDVEMSKPRGVGTGKAQGCKEAEEAAAFKVVECGGIGK
jgi:hypothetical protein